MTSFALSYLGLNLQLYFLLFVNQIVDLAQVHISGGLHGLKQRLCLQHLVNDECAYFLLLWLGLSPALQLPLRQLTFLGIRPVFGLEYRAFVSHTKTSAIRKLSLLLVSCPCLVLHFYGYCVLVGLMSTARGKQLYRRFGLGRLLNLYVSPFLSKLKLGGIASVPVW